MRKLVDVPHCELLKIYFMYVIHEVCNKYCHMHYPSDIVIYRNKIILPGYTWLGKTAMEVHNV